MELFNSLCVRGYCKAAGLKKNVRRFFTSERGASDIIAVVVLVAIVVVLGVAFRKKLVELVGNIWKGVDSNSGEFANQITIGDG